MNAALDLTQSERDELATLLRSNPIGSTPPLRLNELLRQWGAFVAAVERGYDDSIYEYSNDLSVRDILQELLLASSPGLRLKLQRALAPLDERFTTSTEPALKPLRSPAPDPAPWWRRVPKRRVGELADDLDALGHSG